MMLLNHLWNKPAAVTATTIITQIVPADSATAGVNTITIQGQNFAAVPSDNLGHFWKHSCQYHIILYDGHNSPSAKSYD